MDDNNDKNDSTADLQAVVKREESANSGDITVHGDNKNKEGSTHPVDPPEPKSPVHKTKEPKGRHHRVASSTSLKSAGSKRSLIGNAFRRTHSGHIRPVNSVRTTGKPPNLNLGDDAVIGDNGEGGEATWHDVYTACCVHSAKEWGKIATFLFALFFLLYIFLIALDMLGTSFKVVGGCTAGSMLGNETNPMASVMIGIIATALLQSSSTTTAIIVSLVSGGLDVNQAIYMVMGANVGTSVTCMLVSLAHMGDGDELERAFSGSAVLFFFNFMTMLILLPLEITTGFLFRFTKLMLPQSVGAGDKWEGPVKKIVNPIVKKIIIANKGLIDDISTGQVESCASPGFYPTNCIDDDVSYGMCNQTGVIACDKKSGSCPFFFQNGASMQDDMVSGWVCLFIALMLLIFCLIALVTLLRKALLGASTQILYKATNINPFVAIVIGAGVTVFVQSSSITSSTLVPLAGIGVLDLENMFPLILGADIGTTITALLASMVSSKVQALQVALVHVFFNVTGGLIWYPLPFMRRFILRECQFVGKITREWKGFPIVFIFIMYCILPLLVLGISSCFEKKTKGFIALGAFILLILFGIILYGAIWWFRRNGKQKFQNYIQRKQRRAAALEALADDLDYLKVDNEWCKNEIGRIKDFAGHIQTIQMEEGLPLVAITTNPGPNTDTETLATDEDDRLSAFQSCRSKPWKNIIVMTANSVKSEL